MADRTGIAWTDATFNPVWGCTKVSSACRTFGDSHWNNPRRWNRLAERAGQRMRVFCASMADVFDNRWPEGVRDRLWALIRETPQLDWQLLTKRPQNIVKMLPADWSDGYPNVWLGTTAENQTEADRRILSLLAAPAAKRFLSCEPLIGPVDLTRVLLHEGENAPDLVRVAGIKRLQIVANALKGVRSFNWPGLDWVIIGGESGRRARPMRREWAEALIEQCRAAGVPAFFKQVGSNPGHDWPARMTGKGDDLAQWPAEFRVQEFPRV